MNNSVVAGQVQASPSQNNNSIAYQVKSPAVTIQKSPSNQDMKENQT